MHDPIKGIVEFNKQAGFIGGGMDSFKETAYILEEAMEGFEKAFNGMNEEGTPVVPGDPEWITARQWSLSLMNQIHQAFEQRGLAMPTEVEEFDKAIDGIVFNGGRMAKMGLTHEQITHGINIVNERNMAKLGAPKDEHGKQLKPEGWTGPEEELQKILDNRK